MPPIPKRKLSLIERDQDANKGLSGRYELLNQMWASAESKLKSLKPPHEVWVAYGEVSGDEDSPRYWQLLALSKYEGKWRLVHAFDNENNDDGSPPGQIMPIVECNSQIRIEAASIIRKLHLEIVKAKEDYIAQADQAIKELSDAMEGM